MVLKTAPICSRNVSLPFLGYFISTIDNNKEKLTLCRNKKNSIKNLQFSGQYNSTHVVKSVTL